MDLENGTAILMGKGVALNLTTSGHYCIPIDKTEEVPVESVCVVRLQELTKEERFKTLLKYGDGCACAHCAASCSSGTNVLDF